MNARFVRSESPEVRRQYAETGAYIQTLLCIVRPGLKVRTRYLWQENLLVVRATWGKKHAAALVTYELLNHDPESAAQLTAGYLARKIDRQ